MISYDFHFKVYYKDVDQMGIVYYTRYFEMFEMARTELFNNIGIKVTDVEKNGFFLPVVSASCDYKKTASFEQELLIKTSISTLPKARLDIDYSVHLKKDLSNLNEIVVKILNYKKKFKKYKKNLTWENYANNHIKIWKKIKKERNF